MGYRKRIYYTDADKELMWDRWQAGESLHAIARQTSRSALEYSIINDIIYWCRIYQTSLPRFGGTPKGFGSRTCARCVITTSAKRVCPAQATASTRHHGPEIRA